MHATAGEQAKPKNKNTLCSCSAPGLLCTYIPETNEVPDIVFEKHAPGLFRAPAIRACFASTSWARDNDAWKNELRHPHEDPFQEKRVHDRQSWENKKLSAKAGKAMVSRARHISISARLGENRVLVDAVLMR